MSGSGHATMPDMRIPGFIGTFDPAHGAHISQLLRAHQVKRFSEVYIGVDMNPAHKPYASRWQDRVAMAELTFAAYRPAFKYTIIPIENSLAVELKGKIDYKITGADSLIENLSEPERWPLAQSWPMLVLSIPNMPDAALQEALDNLPPKITRSINYEYVYEADVPIMNYDFEFGRTITRRIHATKIRAGQDGGLLPDSVQQYIDEKGLYQQ
jgi:nicotinic acid mononucleotide adenylyltransferase